MPETLAQLSAAILVGGFGTRLQPVIQGGQKVVAPVAGRPFLLLLLDQLVAAGLRQVVLCTGHKADAVEAAVGTGYRGLRVVYSREPEPRGTAGALRYALPLLGAAPVLALNGDSFCELDLAAFHAAHGTRPGTLAVHPSPDTRRQGRVVFAPADGRIISFEEKAATAEPGWISAGIYLLSREFLTSIPPDRAVSIERDSFPAWLGRGLYAFPTRGKFLDIGTPASYSVAQTFFP